MGNKTVRYPTAPELRNMPLQELADRGLIGLLPAAYGTPDTRKR